MSKKSRKLDKLRFFMLVFLKMGFADSLGVPFRESFSQRWLIIAFNGILKNAIPSSDYYYEPIKCTYLIKSDNGLYKIGQTGNMTNRLVHLRVEYHGEALEVIDICETAGHYKFEQYLHKKYKDSRVYGEWFNLDEGQISEIKTLFKNVSNFGVSFLRRKSSLKLFSALT